MTITEFYDTASFLVKITKKKSKGRRHPHHTHLASAKEGRKNRRKRKNSGRMNSQQQQQQQQQPIKILKQSNVDGLIVKSLDMEGFGDHFESMQSKDFTRVAFQNCGRQPQFWISKKVTDSDLVMSTRKYDTLLFAEHRL